MTAALRMVHSSDHGIEMGQGETADGGASTTSPSCLVGAAGADVGGFALSPGQEAAVAKVRDWIDDPCGQRIFRLFGYAGTGKTTIARMLAEEVIGGPVYCAYTGKAALRMRQSGCDNAATIHSTIYKPMEDGDRTAFVWQEESVIADAGIVVVDECSMVNEEITHDLLRYDKPILVLGDPFQLPPVKGQGYLTNAEPDAMLTEVHRQALDNPILELATRIREDGEIKYGEFGALEVIERGTLGVKEVCGYDQVLCGTHRVRRSYTKQMRKHAGNVGAFPESGDRIMCTRNHRKTGLFNGQVFRVTSSFLTSQMCKTRIVDVDDDDERVRTVMSFQEGWQNPNWKPTPQQFVMYPQFDFAQVMTTHKAQGSEWKHVLVYDEGDVFREHAQQWRYTAITRASERLTIVR
ncbi:ATP-binding protein [Jannaschia sp. AI_61]|nr:MULTISPECIES: ATP-dependent RecD-like DNA helicase [unclassified Jannaschia]GIT90133.1 ATP-binding protein [Jannaschia sp. AI_61]